MYNIAPIHKGYERQNVNHFDQCSGYNDILFKKLIVCSYKLQFIIVTSPQVKAYINAIRIKCKVALISNNDCKICL